MPTTGGTVTVAVADQVAEESVEGSRIVSSRSETEAGMETVKMAAVVINAVDPERVAGFWKALLAVGERQRVLCRPGRPRRLRLRRQESVVSPDVPPSPEPPPAPLPSPSGFSSFCPPSDGDGLGEGLGAGSLLRSTISSGGR